MFFSPFASLINREKLCVNREKSAPRIHHIFSPLVFHRLRPLEHLGHVSMRFCVVFGSGSRQHPLCGTPLRLFQKWESGARCPLCNARSRPRPRNLVQCSCIGSIAPAVWQTYQGEWGVATAIGQDEAHMHGVRDTPKRAFHARDCLL